MTRTKVEVNTLTLGYEELFQRLEAGNTLVTGNSRLSRVLTDEYSRWRVARGDKQWATPVVQSWSAWIGGLWESASLADAPGTQLAVPGNRQLISLWEAVLANDEQAHILLRRESLAAQLRDTRKTLIEWRVPLSDAAWLAGDNENYGTFKRWNEAFEHRCHESGWIAPEDRTVVICNVIGSGHLRTDGDTDFLGFDEFSPGQRQLLKSLADNGAAVTHLQLSPSRGEAVLWRSENNDELEHMARWVRHWYETEPGARIGVVVPELQQRRSEVERHLSAILIPGGGKGVTKPWNTSIGVPLAKLPMVETAFDLLGMLAQRVDIQRVGRLLRSPWLRGGISERNNRALLEKCLRENYPSQLKPTEIWYRAGELTEKDEDGNELPPELQEPKPWHSAKLREVLDRLRAFGKNSAQKKPPSAWAEAFDHLLGRLGWPLKGSPDEIVRAEQQSDHWQALQAWRDALGEMATLDATVPNLSLNAAISQLASICREQIFQPRTAAADIQVLGLYEAIGLQFDYLWVVGLHQDNWPAPAHPNPFIPSSLQRAAGLPQSSPQRELAVAQTITQRLLETAPDAVFSYPGTLDGEEVQPSALLVAAGVRSAKEVPAWNGNSWRETVAAADGPALVPMRLPGKLAGDIAKGGSSILKNQALCPFRAFAENRLRAAPLESPADGIPAWLHGNLLHESLEGFWDETRSQKNLLALDEEELEARVRKHIDVVVNENRGLKQRPAFMKVEADRVLRHVLAYLELEKQRDSFEIDELEQKFTPEFAGVTINLYIDRIDRLESGEKVIIDYKSGDEQPSKWFGDRPESPQLPLYAIGAGTVPAGVVFAIIREEKQLFRGVVKRENLFPALPPKPTPTQKYLFDAGVEMEETIKNWRKVMHGLMAEFLAGEANIKPLHREKTCENTWCKMQPLCRVGELRQRAKTGAAS